MFLIIIDFKSLFEKIIVGLKNCHDITIKMDNRINKMVFNGCYNIRVECDRYQV